MKAADRQLIQDAFRSAVERDKFADKPIEGIVVPDGASRFEADGSPSTFRKNVEADLASEQFYADIDRRIAAGETTLEETAETLSHLTSGWTAVAGIHARILGGMEVVSIEDWVKGDYVDIATLDETAGQLAARLPLTFEKADGDGLGELLQALVKLDNGRQFILQQCVEGPPPLDQQTMILCLNDQRTFKSDLQTIVKALNVHDVSELAWVYPDIEPPAPKAPGPASNAPRV